MVKFSQDTLTLIKSRLSIVELVRKTVPGLKKKGRDWWGCCPFHSEKSASFHVRDSEGYYHCFGCGAHGDHFTFAQETRGGSFSDAVQFLADMAGVRVEVQAADPVAEKRRTDGFSALMRACTFYQQQLGGAALAYLQKRGLTPETIQTFSLGFAPEGWTHLYDYLVNDGFAPDMLRETGLSVVSEQGRSDYDRFRNRVMFPIHDLQARVVGFGGRVLDKSEPKYLNSSETAFFNKGATLYNLHRAREHIRRNKQALLVEGYMDVIGLWQAGVQTAVAPLGTAITEGQLLALWQVHPHILVCLDGDNAGRTAAQRVAERALPVLEAGKSLSFVWLPDGEDPDSFILKNGKAAFESLLGDSTPLEDVLWQKVTQQHNPATASGKAAAEGDITRLIETVKDPAVAKHLRAALRDKLWQSGRSGNEKSFIKSTRGQSTVQSVSRLELMMALVLTDPLILHTKEEVFATLEWPDTATKALSSALMTCCMNKTLEKGEVDAYLKRAGLFDAAEKICHKANLPMRFGDQTFLDVWHLLEAQERAFRAELAAKSAAVALAQTGDWAGLMARGARLFGAPKKD